MIEAIYIRPEAGLREASRLRTASAVSGRDLSHRLVVYDSSAYYCTRNPNFAPRHALKLAHGLCQRFCRRIGNCPVG